MCATCTPHVLDAAGARQHTTLDTHSTRNTRLFKVCFLLNMSATRQGHLEVVKLLADSHPAVDTHCKAKDGTTPLDAARTKGHVAVEAFLDRIHSVPAETPLRLRAAQRLSWATALLGGTGCEWSLSPDLLEHVTTRLTAR